MGAIVDLETGKIIGAKRNSLTWFHEKGHIIYNNSDKGIRNSYNRQNIFEAMIFFIILSLFFNILSFIALILFLIYEYYAIYEEIWCWKYAYSFKK